MKKTNLKISTNAFEYAKKHKNVPDDIVALISFSNIHSYWYAYHLNFKNVPDIILESISRYVPYSYEYAKYLNFKNVPDVIFLSITRNNYYSYEYIKSLKYKNFPVILIKKIINYRSSDGMKYLDKLIKNLSIEKHLFLFILKYDKRTDKYE